MKNITTRLLLIEDDSTVAAIISDTLASSGSESAGSYRLVWAPTLKEGLAHLAAQTQAPDGEDEIEVILLGLSHTDNQDIEAFDKVSLAAPELPILLLGDINDPVLARQALQRGAQDYLPRNLLRGGIANWLFRVLNQAIERKSLELALRETENALHAERQITQATLNAVSDAVLSVDAAGNVTHLNSIAEKLTGWPLHEAHGRPLKDVFNIIDGKTRQLAESPFARMLRENKNQGFGLNSVLLHRDGGEFGIEDTVTPLRDTSGAINGALLVFRDVSEARGMALKMAYLAQHDALTDLPNRALMHDRLAQAIVLAKRHQRKVALLYMDLDHFKNINDSLGHPIGDKLLQVVADRLITCVRYSDTVSRQGGDEFVVLLAEIEHPQDAALCAEKMLNALATPVAIDSHQLFISLSIGISIFPDDGEDAETLIRNADTAMYHAKSSGRANFQFFKQAMNDRVVQRQSLEDSLRNALDRHEFILHYQPKIDLENGAITGVEALVRWQHPEKGLISPALFVPVAEECGLMPRLGQWILREACHQAHAWLRAGLDIRRIAVNISAPEFRARNFVGDLSAILSETGLAASFLELELTEGALMHDLEVAQTRLGELKRMGVHIAIDDFGTGYSSLSYLKRFPIDTLKIDRSFVQCMTKDPADAAIVSAVIGMGKSLNYRVVAEGVETQEQQLFLQANLCDESQGHHFSRPLSASGLANLMERRAPELH